jgi:type I restriction enzyme S subunit
MQKELYENSLFNIFKNKNNWISSELGEKATFRNGMNFTKNSKGEKIKIVGVKDFQNNYWVPFEELDSINLDSDLKEIDALNKDDIIAVRSNGNPELIGRTLLAGDFEEKVSHSGFTIRIRLNTDELLPNYVCHFLKSQKARKSLIESGNGVSIKSLNQGSLSSLTINYPKSRTEQKQIVSKIESLKEETAKLEKIYCRKLDDLDELKKSILHKAFNGEL